MVPTLARTRPWREPWSWSASLWAVLSLTPPASWLKRQEMENSGLVSYTLKSGYATKYLCSILYREGVLSFQGITIKLNISCLP